MRLGISLPTGIMYKDFFDPPPKPFGKDKGKGKDKDAGGKKGKGAKGKGKAKADDAALSSPAPTPAPVLDIQVDPISDKKKRRVRFSDAVKVKTIAARGSAFDKLVAKVGWDEASRILEEQGGETKLAGGEEEEDIEEGSDEANEDLEGEGSEGSEEGSDEDVEMEDGEEDGEEDSDEDDGGLEEGLETIERLKTSLFDDEENSEDEGSTPGQSLSPPPDH